MNYEDFLKKPRSCPFCGGTDRHMAENDTAFLTYALAPYHPDHLLIVPKRHIEHILDISDKEREDVNALQMQALHMVYKLGYNNVTILVRDGSESGKSVPHLHYHVIPNIVLTDADHKGGTRKVLDEKEIEDLIARFRKVA